MCFVQLALVTLHTCARGKVIGHRRRRHSRCHCGHKNCQIWRSRYAPERVTCNSVFSLAIVATAH